MVSRLNLQPRLGCMFGIRMRLKGMINFFGCNVQPKQNAQYERQ